MAPRGGKERPEFHEQTVAADVFMSVTGPAAVYQQICANECESAFNWGYTAGHGCGRICRPERYSEGSSRVAESVDRLSPLTTPMPFRLQLLLITLVTLLPTAAR